MPQGYPGQSPYPVMQSPGMGFYGQHMEYTGGMPQQRRNAPPWLILAIIGGAGAIVGVIVLLVLLL
jgi:hypothetical protein